MLRQGVELHEMYYNISPQQKLFIAMVMAFTLVTVTLTLLAFTMPKFGHYFLSKRAKHLPDFPQSLMYGVARRVKYY